MFQGPYRKYHGDRDAHVMFIPAVLIWELVQGDSPVSTRTFEKPLHAVMPVEVMLFADAGLQRLEVGVGALHRGTQTTCQVRGFIGRKRSCYLSPPSSATAGT